jgi:hypothetical protein
VIGFIETTIEYYLPGVDVSALSDRELATKFGHLQRIRELESNSEK